jgi:cytochrome c5
MKVKHMTMIGSLAFMMMSCGLLESKSNARAPREYAATEEGSSGDVVVDEGEPAAKPPVDTPTMDPAMALTGKDLYAKLCANCHGKFEESTVGKTPLNKVNMAIASVPDMAGLQDIKDADLEAIVMALSELPPGKAKGKPTEAAAE